MRKFLMLLLAGSFLASCSNNKSKAKTTTADSTTKTEEVATSRSASNPIIPVPAPGPYEKLMGSFVGPFGTNKITFLITKVQGDSVVGRSIVGGNDRPFRGTFHKDGDFYFLSGREPGDHKDDGEFNWVMSDEDQSYLDGGWKPYAKGRPEKEFHLTRKLFTYRTDVGEFPEASQRLLKAADVENLMKEDLEFMRNEIFARHGFCFSRKHLRQQFEMQDWYIPNTVNIKGFLTDIEKKNIALIQRYEKYAEQYGDEYGR